MAKQTQMLNSSALSMVEWDDETLQMDVTFNNGRTYTFQSVPESVYQGLCGARSAGSYYAQNIKGKYA